MDLFRSFNTDCRVANADYTATTAKRKANEVELENLALERRVDRLALACQALWELLSEKTGITPDELSAKILEVDLRDGRPDGRIGTHVISCPTCGRNVSSAKETCMFCGAPVPHDTIVI